MNNSWMMKSTCGNVVITIKYIKDLNGQWVHLVHQSEKLWVEQRLFVEKAPQNLPVLKKIYIFFLSSCDPEVDLRCPQLSDPQDLPSDMVTQQDHLHAIHFFFWNPTRSGSNIINIYTIYINLYLWGASRASSPVVMSRNTSRAPSRAPSQAPSRAPSCGPSGAATPEVGSPSAPTTWGFHNISRIYRPETWWFFFEGAASATCVTLGEVPPKCWNMFCSNKTLRSGNSFEQFLPWGYLMFSDWCMAYVWVKTIVTLNS